MVRVKPRMPNADASSLSSTVIVTCLRRFASSDPTPGGGSASALAGAVGASLLVMVASLPKTAARRRMRIAARSRRAVDALRPAAAELAALVDRDARHTIASWRRYRLPKATDADKAARRDAIQQAMRGATDAPLAMMRACAAAAARRRRRGAWAIRPQRAT